MQGQLINKRYKIEKIIGRGGMATVYKAFDLVLKRPIAIKILHQQLTGNAHFVERFRREAFAAANLIHPNITTIYDTGYSDGYYYIVMEYIEGKTLKQIIDERAPLPISEAVDIARQIAKALGQAHSRKIIHRDIKPQNILITEEGNVKVTDFGIARALMMPGLTQTGKVLGTARYISPEQAKGHQADERSDLYSLGVIFYEMLAGKPLFEGSSSVEMAEKHVKERPPSLLNLNPNVPLTLEIIVGRLLRKDPNERYQSIDKLIEDLSVWETREVYNLVSEELSRRNVSRKSTSRGKHAATRRNRQDKSKKNSNYLDFELELNQSGKRNESNWKLDYYNDNKTGAAELAVNHNKVRAKQRTEGEYSSSISNRFDHKYRVSDENRARRGNNNRNKKRQTNKRKRLTPFAKILLILLVFGTSLAVWNFFKPEQQTLSKTQIVLKKQAEAEKRRNIAMQGLQVGQLNPIEAVDYDPEGSDQENPSLISNLIDKNPKTFWITEAYRNKKFGKLKKGVGAYIDFGVPRNVQQLVIDSCGGWSGEIKGSNDLNDWITVAKIEDAKDNQSIELEKYQFRYYMVWISSLSFVDGSYRCKIYEIKARGY